MKDGNGLFVLDLQQRPHDPARQRRARLYNRLTWNDDGTALAVLKGVDVEKMRERDNVLVVYPERAGARSANAPKPTPVVLDPAKADGVPEGLGRERSRGARRGATTTSACSSA